MESLWIGCAEGNFTHGRPAGFLPEAIVIHIMDGSLKGTDQFFNDPSAKVSAHYGVGKNGEIHQYVDESDTAFHAGIVVRPSWKMIKARANPNFYTIGIEHEGRADDDWQPAQMASSLALAGEIARRWNIDIDRDHIIGHREIRATKTCPGSWIGLDTYVNSILPGIPEPARDRRTVRVLANVRLRAGRPATSAQIVRVLAANTQVVVTGFTATGERINGNSCWYRDTDGNYFWAGATDIPTPEQALAAGA